MRLSLHHCVLRLMLALGLAVGAGALHAQGSALAPAASRLTGQSPARASHLRPVQQSSSLHRAAADSSLQAAGSPATKLEQVRQLKQSLKARETAQQEIVIDLPSDVLFDFDKSTLRPDAIPVLAQAAQLIGAYPQSPVCINGHTDSKGSDAYNQALSLRRARAVAMQLQGGQAARPMQVRGFGESRPVAANTMPGGMDNPEGRQRNRRVEIVIGALGGAAAAHTSGSCTAAQ